MFFKLISRAIFAVTAVVFTTDQVAAQPLRKPVSDLAATNMVISSNYGLVIATVQNLGRLESQTGQRYVIEKVHSDGTRRLVATSTLPAIRPGRRHNVKVAFRQQPGTTRTYTMTISPRQDVSAGNNKISRTHTSPALRADLAAEIVVDPHSLVITSYVRNVGNSRYAGNRTARRSDPQRGPEFTIGETVKIIPLGPGQRQMIFRQPTRDHARQTFKLIISPGDHNAENDVATKTR